MPQMPQMPNMPQRLPNGIEIAPYQPNAFGPGEEDMFQAENVF